ncbi:Zinc finger MYM-type protein 2, partial [Camelus dromedarius]
SFLLDRFFGMDAGSVGGLDLTDQTPVLLGSTAMATSLTNAGNSFSGPPNPLVPRSSKFQNSSVEDDDDVVFIEPVQPPPPPAPADQRTVTFTSSKNEELQGNDSKVLPSSKELASQKGSVSETIVIDDEEDVETNQGQEKNSNFIERRPSETKNRTNDVDFSTSSFSRSKVNAGMGSSGITTEPDSEIQIANVTTLETGVSAVNDGQLDSTDGRDMNLMITHVTSLQNASLGDVSNGLQSSNFGVNIQTYTPSLTSQTKTAVGPFNPGRVNVAGDVFQNGESATHHNPEELGRVDITTMKGTIVAQVDSSESFQEFCSTSCLSLYEDKQNPTKGALNKSRCTICGKLTEVCVLVFCRLVGSHPSFLKEVRDHMQDTVLMQPEKYGKLTTCTGCRTQCRFFDMTQCIGPNGYMEPYCSTACMNSHKTKYAKSQSLGIICHFCKRNSLPQYQATMPDGKLYNFCNSSCVAKFQALSVQSSPNGQFVAPSDIQLKCNYCKNSFCSKPEILEWEASPAWLCMSCSAKMKAWCVTWASIREFNKVHQFCSKTCSDDYKKLHCIVTYCEYCQEEKTLHETVNFSGVKRPFCSEGKCCKLLYKQDFARRLGLRCVTCNYCSQLCKKGATKELDGVVRDFCSEDCCRRFQDWYYKASSAGLAYSSAGPVFDKVQAWQPVNRISVHTLGLA